MRTVRVFDRSILVAVLAAVFVTSGVFAGMVSGIVSTDVLAEPTTEVMPVRSVNREALKPSVGGSQAKLAPVQSTPKEKSFSLNEDGVKNIVRGDRAKGESLIKQAIEVDPNNVTALYNLAGLYLAQGKPDDAIVAMRKAVALDPEEPSLLNRLAEVYFAQNDLDSAIDGYTKIIKISPGYEQSNFRLGTLYALKGSYPEAEKYLRLALKQYPDDSRVLSNLGSVLVAAKKYNDAIVVLEKAHKQKESVESTLALAVAYESKGDKELAKRYFTEAKRLGSENRELSEHVQELTTRVVAGQEGAETEQGAEQLTGPASASDDDENSEHP